MANGNSESPSPKSVSSVKRGMSPEDQQDQNPPKRLKRTDVDASDAEGSSNGDYISDDKRSPTPTNESHNSPEPHQPSRLAKILPSIEVSHHQGYSEGNVPPLEGMNDTIFDTIVDTIEEDPNRTGSASHEPTILERHTSSPSSTQKSRESSVEDDINNSPLLHSASFPSASPIQPQNFSPSPTLLLTELPNLSPTPVSSATASATPPASNWVNFSPSPASGSSSYTSISEGDSEEEDWDDLMFNLPHWQEPGVTFVGDGEDEDSDEHSSEEEDWDDEMFNLWIEAHEQNPGPDVNLLDLVLEAVVNPHWQGRAPVQQPGVTFVGDGEDEDNDEHNSEDDSETEAESASDSEQEVRNIPFASRYDRWPDFDASDDENTYNYYSSEESDEDADFEGIRYPGMNVFRLSDYNWSEPGDQQPDVTYLTDDEGDDSDDDDPESDFESEPETEAQWWGGGFRIIYYNRFCM